MKLRPSTLVLFLAITVVIDVAEADKVLTAVIRGTASNEDIFGLAQIVEVADGSITVSANVKNLPSGLHGFHIHTYGDIVGKEDGTAAGGHFNPNAASHAGPSDLPRHVGDLGNINSTNGEATYTRSYAASDAARPTVDQAFANSVIGRSFVIHAAADDLESQPTGNAGSRLAVGVIGIGNNPADEAINFIESAEFETPSALVCMIHGEDGMKGAARIVLNADGVAEVSAAVSGFTTGPHGFHVHHHGEEYDFSATDPVRDLTRTSGHYNPSGVAHALPPADTRHAGDMGNLQVGEDGAASLVVTLPDVTSLKHLVGRTCLVHAGEDDGSDPAGNAGARVAAGQLGYAHPETMVQIPADVVDGDDEDGSEDSGAGRVAGGVGSVVLAIAGAVAFLM